MLIIVFFILVIVMIATSMDKPKQLEETQLNTEETK